MTATRAQRVMWGPVYFYKPCPRCKAKRGEFTWYEDGSQVSSCGCGRTATRKKGARRSTITG